MNSNIVSSIICSEFQKRFRDNVGCTAADRAMLVKFSLNIDHEVEDGNRHLELLIFGNESNYIKVFARLDWRVRQSGEFDQPDGAEAEGKTPWVLLADHDSCWRGDGVESLLSSFQEQISCIDSLFTTDGWYSTKKMTASEIGELRDLWTNRTQANLKSLEFHFPVA
jgi:hypothetical protein